MELGYVFVTTKEELMRFEMEEMWRHVVKVIGRIDTIEGIYALWKIVTTWGLTYDVVIEGSRWEFKRRLSSASREELLDMAYVLYYNADNVLEKFP